ncbi:MAG: hypothetical protein ACOY4R_27565 [Pseudomonadota bacterium]
MTVAELLDRIIAIYPGANPQALVGLRPVFLARLGHREGAHLESAANEVFAEFQPKNSKPFPIPIDFESRMPSVHVRGDGPKLDLQGHRERKARLVAEWWERQGNRIREHRGALVASACAHMIINGFYRVDLERPRAKPVFLSLSMRAYAERPEIAFLRPDEIQMGEDRVVSSERMGTHGVLALRSEEPAAWQAQMDEIRPLVRAGRSPSAERKERVAERKAGAISRAVTERLTELAAQRREPAEHNA